MISLAETYAAYESNVVAAVAGNLCFDVMRIRKDHKFSIQGNHLTDIFYAELQRTFDMNSCKESKYWQVTLA